VAEPAAIGVLELLAVEARKVPAFFRRDLMVALSYRTAFVFDWLSLVIQMVTFSYVAKLVDTSAIPPVGGRPVSYLEFVAVGISVTSFLQIALGRVVTTIRGERLMGTLETLLLTPTSKVTLQLGVVAYDLLYVPLRTALFLAGTAVIFDVDLRVGGLLPFIAVLGAFIPFVWGLGVAAAASVLAFRRGNALSGFAAVLLTLSSGAYFPPELLPKWAVALADWNPAKVALEAARDALLGTAGWGDIEGPIAKLLLMAVVALVVGFGAFALALRHERRRGTLGQY
jgi:ABC-2 type transport system permease protein